MVLDECKRYGDFKKEFFMIMLDRDVVIDVIDRALAEDVRDGDIRIADVRKLLGFVVP